MTQANQRGGLFKVAAKSPFGLICGALAALALAAPQARADDAAPEAKAAPLHVSFLYTADALSVVSGGERRGTDYVGAALVSADADLEQMVGWKGGSAHVDLWQNFGGEPSARAGSMLGLDGNEADGRRLRMPQLWVQQAFAGGRASVLAGFYDTESEFNAAESASLLVGAASGSSPEWAESGSGGPSAFPETALAVRLRVQPNDKTYAILAVANAKAGAVGDPGGPDFKFREGVLVMAEAGYTGSGKLALGLWRYSKSRPDIRDLDEAGDPQLHTSQGAYVVVERPLNAPEDEVRKATAFLKLGISEASTTPYSGSVNAGVLVEHVFKSRPDSGLSFGLSHGRLTGKVRANGADEEMEIGSGETTFELTYADRLSAHLKVQPDLQWIHRPSGERAIPDAFVVGVRFNVEF
ncbi:MAG: carbohydrate porin [Phenylobacterium sp.]